MSIFYRSRRVGKNGKEFWMIKFRTLVNGSDKQVFSNEATYTRFGKFLRRTKIDELPGLWNWIKGDLQLVGPRSEEKRTIDILPKNVQETILSVRPGVTSPASIYFFDEGTILEQSSDPISLYWKQIKPMKILLDTWYISNKCFLLDIAVLWITFCKVIKAILWK